MENITLYVRGMNGSDMDDVWDDTALNCAYDKALKMANEEVAKRIAMETNSSSSSKSKSDKGKGKATKEPQKTESSIAWKEGMPCRAMYEEDGLEYEAFLVHIMGDDCIVKFLGYDNNERVPLSSLKRSLGDKARMQQVYEAVGEARERGDDDGFESQPGSESRDLYSDVSMELPRDKKKKAKSSKKRASIPDLPAISSLPMPIPGLLRNMGASDMPFAPPPPLMALAGRNDAEEQAISDMLLSWYMTGYYTGLYQGMKRQKQSRRSH